MVTPTPPGFLLSILCPDAVLCGRNGLNSPMLYLYHPQQVSMSARDPGDSSKQVCDCLRYCNKGGTHRWYTKVVHRWYT